MSPAPTTAEEDPCGLVPGEARRYCERGQEQRKRKESCSRLAPPLRKHCETGDGGSTDGSLNGPVLDPMASLADAVAQGAAWVVDRLSDAIAATGETDFTNRQFLRTYSLVFAGSTFLVILIWLWAAMKRAVRGVPLTTAIGEAVGLLWLTVLASAFTPLALYTVVTAVDGITEVLAGGGDRTRMFAAFSTALTSNDDGGPFIKVVLSLVCTAAAGVLWLEMVIRAALLYVGAVLGTVVYAGLVDRDLWSRVRRWVGLMAAVILVKPIIVVVLRLASVLSTGGPTDTVSAIVSGLAIILLAIIASAMIFRLLPGMGDEVIAMRRDSYDPASRQTSALVTRPVTGITQGINTHAARDSVSRASATAETSPPSVAHASSGIAAHSARPTSPPPMPPRPPAVPPQDSQGSQAWS
ncbi:hypothetical protein [Streptomyces achromogenes]|uniref:hypothetical protein n=1 Tax=Streptomyces achromogenes TaxID=67255 RepID=UPI003438B0A8